MKRKLFLTTSLLTCLVNPLQAALLNLTQSPLFLGYAAPPNVFFSVDDSGSMDWEFMMTQPYWNFCAYDPNATGIYSPLPTCGGIVENDGLPRSFANLAFRNFSYIFQNTDNVFPDDCLDANFNATSICPAAIQKDWRLISSDLNTIYYNPTSTYVPWSGQCLTNGQICSDANFTSAKSNPIQGSPGYTSVKNLTGNSYEVWIDDKGYSGVEPMRALSLNVTNGANGIVDLWDSHVTFVINAANVQVFKTTYAPNALGMNPTTTLQTTLTGNACFNALGSAETVRTIFNGGLAYNSTGGADCRTRAELQTNYANWYQYSRRRALVAKGAVSNVISQFPNFRYGINGINSINNFFREVPPSGTVDFTPYNTALLNALFQYNWQLLLTPLRSGLARVGQYYSNQLVGKANPITLSCQQNYAILLTDGFWNLDVVPAAIGDVDGDGIAQTLADVARYYYLTDLSSLANNVVANAEDPATYQHMVTYTIGFGVTGNLVDTDDDGLPNPPLQVNSNWGGNPFTDSSAKIDDLWHAAFNSKGRYLGGQNASTIQDALTRLLNNISLRSASAVPVAQNSTVLNASSLIYQATFNSNNWFGDLVAYPVSLTGTISGSATWSANCLLTGGACTNPILPANAPATSPTSRTIITRDWTGADNGIAFRWPANYASFKVGGNLPTNLRNFLSKAPFNANTSNSTQITANQAYGAALLNYLRGERVNEAQNGGTYDFRNRANILGDIVDSAPTYVGPPQRLYPDNLETAPYSTFRNTYTNRTPVIYVGANDGMLHGFNANTGREVLGYVPGITGIYQDLPVLSVSPLAHNYFVNSTPTDADVYFSSSPSGWRTILTGTLGNGGQGLYILDITNPTNFTEANASQIYLSEFTDLNDADLGFVPGPVTVAKVRLGGTSKWAIIMGNGYNNSQADGAASTNGKAALYILFIEDGIKNGWILNTNYFKIPVGTGSTGTPNGLASPYPVDKDGDLIVDYVYGGDLQGNMWRFDLTDTNPANWASKATLIFTTLTGQPITASPVVTAHPTGIENGFMVYFGTGKYLETTDNTSNGQTTQSFYGIWDKLASGSGALVNRNKLLQQQIITNVTLGTPPVAYRAVTNTPVVWTSGATQNLGWYLNLVEGSSPNNGERQVSRPILRNNNVIFTTIIPSTDPCAFGGSGWLMEVSAANGGAPLASPFDVNNDGKFTSADYLTVTFNNANLSLPAAGQKTSSGMTGTPTVFTTPGRETEIKITSGSQGLTSVVENPGNVSIGRQNWRQLY